MNLQWSAPLLAAFLFTSCDVQDSKPVADRGTNDETSSFYLQNGQKASNATVTVFAAGGTDTLPTTRSYTNSDGQVTFSALPKGYYSLLVTDKTGRAVFVDSVYSDGAKMDLPSDTLRPTGSIKGRIKVQTQDDPKIAWVALVGEGYFHTIDDDSGLFTLTGVPAGRHTLVAKTDRGDYTSTFRTATVVPDSTTNVGTIDLVYTGLPIVTGIIGTWDSLGGAVALRWDASTSSKVKGYAIYRSYSTDPVDEKRIGFVDSSRTFWIDTIFQATNFARAETTYVKYRVAAIGQLDINVGSLWNFWSNTLRSSYLAGQLHSTRTLVSSSAPTNPYLMDTLPGSLVLVDGTEVNASVYLSDNGGVWTKIRTEIDSAADLNLEKGLLEGISYKGRFWWVRKASGGRKTILPGAWDQALDLADSLRILSLDASGRIDSFTVAASGDSVSRFKLIPDSTGIVLLEGMAHLNAMSALVLHPWSKRLLQSDGNFADFPWTSWFTHWPELDTWPSMTTFENRLVSPKGHVTPDAKETVSEDAQLFGQPHLYQLDLDSLLIGGNGDFYALPGNLNHPHRIAVDEASTAIAYWRGKVWEAGGGKVWTLTLP